MSSSFYFFIFSLMKPTKHANSVSTSSPFWGRWSVICYSVFNLKAVFQLCIPNIFNVPNKRAEIQYIKWDDFNVWDRKRFSLCSKYAWTWDAFRMCQMIKMKKRWMLVLGIIKWLRRQLMVWDGFSSRPLILVQHWKLLCPLPAARKRDWLEPNVICYGEYGAWTGVLCPWSSSHSLGFSFLGI